MGEWRESAEFGGITNEDIEAAPTVEDRSRELIDLDKIAQIERYKRRAPARGADPVIDLLKAACRARREHEMRALACEPLGDCCSDAS